MIRGIPQRRCCSAHFCPHCATSLGNPFSGKEDTRWQLGRGRWTWYQRDRCTETLEAHTRASAILTIGWATPGKMLNSLSLIFMGACGDPSIISQGTMPWTWTPVTYTVCLLLGRILPNDYRWNRQAIAPLRMTSIRSYGKLEPWGHPGELQAVPLRGPCAWGLLGTLGNTQVWG